MTKLSTKEPSTSNSSTKKPSTTKPTATDSSTQALKLFISYSHDSDAHCEKVLSLTNRLRRDGFDAIIDQQVNDPDEGWNPWMDNGIEDADFVLLLCTETYKKRVMGKEKQGIGLGAKFEGKLIYNAISRNDSRNSKFIPILFSDDDKPHIPNILGGNYYLLNSVAGYEQLCERLLGNHRAPVAPLGDASQLPQAQPRQEPPDFFEMLASENTTETTQPANHSNANVNKPNIDISNLPSTTTTLFGREKQLKMLNDDWFNPNTNIRCLIAWGGVGKTSLINTWLSQLREENYRDARVLGYSFYSQGSSDDRQVSVESFVQVLINWLQLSEQQQAAMPTSAHEKGVYLANQILKQKSLLILDGLEPMQFPPGNDAKHTGILKDATLKALLKQLATAAPGDNSPLLVITSRLSVTDLQNFFNTSVQEHSLENLSRDAGIQLLEHLGVKGRQKELEAAVKEVAGHALAVSLLGTLVKKRFNGDIAKRDKLQNLATTGGEANTHIKNQHAKHAYNVLAAYQSWLQESDSIYLNILNIMGLFDRPIDWPVLEVLLAPPAIQGVTDVIIGASPGFWGRLIGKKSYKSVSKDDLREVLTQLHELGLVNAFDGEHTGFALDCHPLIREYFAEQLQQHNPKGYQAAHQRLYEYFKTVPEKQQPDTVQEMEPLFMAVAHGCKAGLHQQTIEEVYWPRIQRGGKHYLTHKLGAFDADLACIAHFFQQTWDMPAQGLNEAFKAGVLNWAAFRLRGLGRLQEAVQPLEAGLRLRIEEENYISSAMNASNLSQLLLSIGQIDKAVKAGEQAVYYADLSEDENWQFIVRTTLADASYHRASTASIERISDNKSESGSESKAENKAEIKTESENANDAKTLPIARNSDWQRALTLFEDAEQRQQQRQPQFQYLYSLQGFQYCQLLLSLGRVEEVVERVEALFTYRQSGDPILDISLENLSMGKALFLTFKQLFSVSGSEPVENISEQAQVLLNESHSWLDKAVEGLRDAGTLDHLPRGLFARTEFFTFIQHHTAAWHNLDEAYDIASYGGMQLHLTDYYLAAAEDIQTQLGWRKGAQGLAQELGLELDLGLDEMYLDDRDLGDRDLYDNNGTEAESTTGFVIKQQGRLLHPTQTEMEQRLDEYLKKAGELMQECHYFLHKQRLQTLKDTAAEHGL